MTTVFARRRPDPSARDQDTARAARHRGRLLGVLVATGAVLRLWDLGASRLNYDESFTAMAGRLPIVQLFGFLRRSDSHPPLDYLLRAPISARD